jgi:rhodanese-related sulfurtransferase
MNLIEQNWPILALALWFTYKWWSAKQVVLMLPELRQSGALFIDVRSVVEFSAVNAPGTINIPLQLLRSKLSDIPKDRDVVLCCASGSRSGMASLLLKSQGYKRVHNIGSWSNLTGGKNQ